MEAQVGRQRIIHTAVAQGHELLYLPSGNGGGGGAGSVTAGSVTAVAVATPTHAGAGTGPRHPDGGPIFPPPPPGHPFAANPPQPEVYVDGF
jgi:hypothetical protein